MLGAVSLLLPGIKIFICEGVAALAADHHSSALRHEPALGNPDMDG